MEGIPKMVGQKVEELVGDTMNKVMGKEDKKDEEKGVSGKDDKGFGIGDALSLVGGGDKDNKEEEGGAAKVMGTIGSLFN